MAKVTNLTDRGVKLRKWRILPKSSKVVDQDGHVLEVLPDEVAYCRQAKALADEGVLKLDGYTPKKLKKAPAQENTGAKPIVPPPPPKVDPPPEKPKEDTDPTLEVKSNDLAASEKKRKRSKK